MPATEYAGVFDGPKGARKKVKRDWAGALVVAPPSTHGSAWVKKFGPQSAAVCSGWMTVRGTRRRMAVDRGFALSDHADWPGLLGAVAATGASRVLVTHGYTAVLARYLAAKGLETGVVETRFAGDADGEPDDEPAHAGPPAAAEGGRMNAFAALFSRLDETTKTGEKVAALAAYFAAARPADGAWAVYFLTGRKPRQVVPAKLLKAWAADAAGVPDWLFAESYSAVGDLAETLALLVPPAIDTPATSAGLADWVEARLLPLRRRPEADQRAEVFRAWAELDTRGRFVWNNLITGSLRVGVSQLLVVRGLAEATGVPAEVVSHRLMGEWTPTAAFFGSLAGTDDGATAASRPYPFYLASQLDGDPAALGPVGEWAAEWKWDGIRSQLVRRAGQTFLWSRGEELIGDRFPEIAAAAKTLPDGTVIDGEVLPWGPAGVRPFAELQRRIGRTTLTAKILADIPTALVAYDLLELAGRDVRGEPWRWRRAALEAVAAGRFPVSPLVPAGEWADWTAARTGSRARGVEGLMLKRADSPYRVGRVRGDWWKWKVDPYTVDAVLVAAQKGTGKRAGLFSDYTFAVWDGPHLVPVAKAFFGADRRRDAAGRCVRDPGTRPTSSARSGRSGPSWCSRSGSRGSNFRPGTSPAWPPGSRASCGGARTSRRPTRTRSPRSAGWRRWARPPRR